MRSRFFQPFNGARVDAIRDAIEREHAGTPYHPILLTSLARGRRPGRLHHRRADGLREGSGRRARTCRSRCGVPELLAGRRRAAPRRRARRRPHARRRATSPTSTRRTTSTATSPTTTCGRRWSRGTRPSTTAWRASASTPVTTRPRACSTAAGRCPTRSRRVIAAVQARVVVVSYNDESWVTADELRDMCAVHGHVEMLALRLAPLRRRADRDPQPAGRARRYGVARAQPGVRRRSPVSAPRSRGWSTRPQEVAVGA